MNKLNVSKIYNVVYSSMITVPGVAGFANLNEIENQNDNFEEKYKNSIKILREPDLLEIYIYIILISGVNINDIAQEVQFRVKYELESKGIINEAFLVNVVVCDIK
ncbi:Asp23/Gls24 family envelope stress response protein [Spiroplasma endosymbiont of Anurida maritima]|uniref:Asp23/Gls24 family envelope stress response protein n=1 Tax=Spiroplasma endosymbiont of Anurida maritima TaxID=2967972 RepID=UPI0036D25384